MARPARMDDPTWREQVFGPEDKLHVLDPLPDGTVCPNPKCGYVLTDQDEQDLMLSEGMFYCPNCHGNYQMFDPDEYAPGGSTRSTLTLRQVGDVGEEVIRQMGEIPTLGRITEDLSHLGKSGGMNKATDAGAPDFIVAGNDGVFYAVEVKANDARAQERFKIGDAKERQKKAQWALEHGYKPVLVGVRLNFYTDQASIFVQPNGFLDTWMGSANMRHVATVPFVDHNPFKAPSAPTGDPYEAEGDEFGGVFGKTAAVEIRDMQNGEEILPHEHSNAITSEQGIKALLNSQPVGNITYDLMDDYVYVPWIYVEPEYRGTGVMRAMVDELYRRFGLPLSGEFFNRSLEGYVERRNLELPNVDPEQPWNAKTAALQTEDYEGEVGNTQHITRVETGTVPTEAVANLMGVRGERPNEHRNRQDTNWEEFKADIAQNGIRNPIFITVDPGQEPLISEGNHRRDAAVELGLPEVPVEIRYFGHAEQTARVAKTAQQNVMYHVSVDGNHEQTGFDERGMFVFDNIDEAISFGNGWLEKSPNRYLYAITLDDPSKLRPDEEWEAIEEEPNEHAMVLEAAVSPQNVKLIDTKTNFAYWTPEDFTRLTGQRMAKTNTMYHISWKGNRDSILKHGLNWEHSESERRLDNTDMEGGWQRGQYLFTTLEQAKLAASNEDDIWAIDTTDLTLSPDPYDTTGEAVYTTEPISPAHLTLLSDEVEQTSGTIASETKLSVTAPIAQDELRVRDTKGKPIATIRRCKNCGFTYWERERRVTDCPTCGRAPTRVEAGNTTKVVLAGPSIDQIASDLGWEFGWHTKRGERVYVWTDEFDVQHRVQVGSGAHGKGAAEIDAQKGRARMRKCMEGKCHHGPSEELGVEEEGESSMPVIKPGQQVSFGGKRWWVSEVDGGLVAIYDPHGQTDITTVDKLRVLGQTDPIFNYRVPFLAAPGGEYIMGEPGQEHWELDDDELIAAALRKYLQEQFDPNYEPEGEDYRALQGHVIFHPTYGEGIAWPTEIVRGKGTDWLTPEFKQQILDAARFTWAHRNRMVSRKQSALPDYDAMPGGGPKFQIGERVMQVSPGYDTEHGRVPGSTTYGVVEKLFDPLFGSWRYQVRWSEREFEDGRKIDLEEYAKGGAGRSNTPTMENDSSIQKIAPDFAPEWERAPTPEPIFKEGDEVRSNVEPDYFGVVESVRGTSSEPIYIVKWNGSLTRSAVPEFQLEHLHPDAPGDFTLPEHWSKTAAMGDRFQVGDRVMGITDRGRLQGTVKAIPEKPSGYYSIQWDDGTVNSMTWGSLFRIHPFGDPNDPEQDDSLVADARRMLGQGMSESAIFSVLVGTLDREGAPREKIMHWAEAAIELAKSGWSSIEDERLPADISIEETAERNWPDTLPEHWSKIKTKVRRRTTKTAGETANQMLRRLKDVEEKQGWELPDATTEVFRWPDGWSVVKLDNVGAVAREGILMNHCWGDYCSVPTEVDEPISAYYSLRDPRNVPKASFYMFGPGSSYARSYAPPESYQQTADVATITDAYGHGDSDLKPEYWARLQDFLRQTGGGKVEIEYLTPDSNDEARYFQYGPDDPIPPYDEVKQREWPEHYEGTFAKTAMAFQGQGTMYHATARDNLDRILREGLRVDQDGGFVAAGGWADEHYGLRPIYLSSAPGRSKDARYIDPDALGDLYVILQVDVTGLPLVADLPGLYDSGATVDEEGMWYEFKGDSDTETWIPESLKPFERDEMISYEDLLGEASGAAAEATGTAASLQDIPPERIRVWERTAKIAGDLIPYERFREKQLERKAPPSDDLDYNVWVDLTCPKCKAQTIRYYPNHEIRFQTQTPYVCATCRRAWKAEELHPDYDPHTAKTAAPAVLDPSTDLDVGTTNLYVPEDWQNTEGGWSAWIVPGPYFVEQFKKYFSDLDTEEWWRSWVVGPQNVSWRDAQIWVFEKGNAQIKESVQAATENEPWVYVVTPQEHSSGGTDARWHIDKAENSPYRQHQSKIAADWNPSLIEPWIEKKLAPLSPEERAEAEALLMGPRWGLKGLTTPIPAAVYTVVSEILNQTVNLPFTLPNLIPSVFGRHAGLKNLEGGKIEDAPSDLLDWVREQD